MVEYNHFATLNKLLDLELSINGCYLYKEAIRNYMPPTKE